MKIEYERYGNVERINITEDGMPMPFSGVAYGITNKMMFGHGCEHPDDFVELGCNGTIMALQKLLHNNSSQKEATEIIRKQRVKLADIQCELGTVKYCISGV